MKRIVFGLMMVVIVASSCKKGTEFTSLKVTVYDPYTNIRIANWPLTLTEIKKTSSLNIGGIGYNFNSTILNEVHTDSNGEYDFGEFNTQKNDKYTYTINEKLIDKGVHNDVSLNASNPCSVNVNFLPPPPYGSGDSLVINFVYDAYEKYKVTNNNYTTSHQLTMWNPGTYYINIDKFKSGIYTNTKDTVFYADGSTNNYTVNW
jgi:hypothetical protein